MGLPLQGVVLEEWMVLAEVARCLPSPKTIHSVTPQLRYRTG